MNTAAHIKALKHLIDCVDGKTLATPSGDGTFVDDGIVDTEDAVRAVNGLAEEIERLRAAHTDRSIPCPTCGFHVRQTEPQPFVIRDDDEAVATPDRDAARS